MDDISQKLLAVLRGQPVIPVIRIEDAADAPAMVGALVRGGLPAVEITLRTPAALEAIRLAAAECEGAIVGAGTILDARQFEQARDAGSRFIVSPGGTIELLDAAKGSDVPLLPGAITPSEMMAMREEGYRVMKFFPAEQAGGAPFLKSLSSPLADIVFCPTGGISLKNMKDYLSLPNVACVGGSWLTPDDLVKAKAWDRIEALAREAVTAAG
jgi:2-dehydro-3-deoxyphosphogluconate aldolase/(4S)-4-hydroxy-2-oxoglutarate aldolase